MADPNFSEFGPNAGYVEEIFRLFVIDPGLVGENWATYFSSLNGIQLNGDRAPTSSGVTEPTPSLAEGRVAGLLAAYRTKGHFRAQVNPLSQGISPLPDPGDLAVEQHGFNSSDLDRVVPCGGFQGNDRLALRELLALLSATYCSSVGFEYQHLTNLAERSWFEARIETEFPQRKWFSAEEKKRFARLLVESEAFDAELHRQYVGSKRFSLQGGKTLIPMLDALLEQAAHAGVHEAFIGMAHRGRLNVLVNTLGKPFREIFAEFEDKSVASVIGAGDVKYHLGYRSQYSTLAGRAIRVTLAPNPSHLEFVNPIVAGMVRAHQDLANGGEKSNILPILIHGDAAFSGQGVVYEALNFSQTRGHTTGGTIHIVINNQVGFTTYAEEGRSSPYCTDLARGIDIPVFHVNSLDVEACCWVMQLAQDFRSTYGRDVIVDLYCYRKFGHNEGDDPSFTQPQMYAEIKNLRPAAEVYCEQLVGKGVLDADQPKDFRENFLSPFNAARLPDGVTELGEACAIQGRLRDKSLLTAVDEPTVRHISQTLIEFPADFVPHPKLKTILEKRHRSLESDEGIEWGLAEALSFGSLVRQGISVRLSGQDCGRGTFSHRHLELHDYEKSSRYYPLSALENQGAKFEVYNSTLSEAAVMGFEFGYASEKSQALVLWEGQFGDFGNGAQVIIDQFISSSEAKWGQRSGLVLLLPHGYEGQGPEHSSARLERYLQLCAEGNMSVCNPSNAAQYFHLLRRQGLTEIKRPLIVMTPKSLLRHPEAGARLAQLTSGGFQPVISEDISSGKPERVLLMCGKVYYDVNGLLNSVKSARARVIRVEELYPFPERELRQALEGMIPKSVSWVQEEPKNMGAYYYMEARFREVLGLPLHYIGRLPSASTAAGSGKWHTLELNTILAEVRESIS